MISVDEPLVAEFSLSKPRALAPFAFSAILTAFAFTYAFISIALSGLTYVKTLCLPAILLCVSFRSAGVWLHGHYIRVYTHKIIGVHGYQKLNVQNRDIKGFTIENNGEGDGVIYLNLKNGKRFRLPPVANTGSAWEKLVDHTGTREASIELKSASYRRVWLLVTVIVVASVLAAVIASRLRVGPY